MAHSARALLKDLPALLSAAEVSALLRLDVHTVQRMLRDGEIPGGIKVSATRWRVPLESVEAILAGRCTPAQRRCELLGDDTMAFLAELAAGAPPLTEGQRDAIRVIFSKARK